MRKMSKYAKKRKQDPAHHWLLRKSVSEDAKRDLLLCAYQSIDMMKKGQATINEVALLNTALHVGKALAYQDFGSEHLMDFQKAIDACGRAYARGKKTGVHGLDGEGMTDIGFAMQIYEAQLEVITLQRLKQTITMVDKSFAIAWDRINSKEAA